VLTSNKESQLRDTVSAQIERHSWLERQETSIGRTMVIFFGENLSKDDSILEQRFAKTDLSAEAKSPKY